MIRLSPICQSLGGPLIHLLHELFHALPGHKQRGRDDQHDRRPKQELAFGGQRDMQLSNPLEHAAPIVLPTPTCHIYSRHNLPVVLSWRRVV